MAKIHVIGVSETLAEIHNFDPAFWAGITKIVATSRYKELVPQEILGDKFFPISPLEDAITMMGETEGDVVVLASGDPLFYGIGNTLLARLPEEDLFFYPSLSSIQKAAALCRTSWHDAKILSLHGRNKEHIAGKILNQQKVFILTDKNNTPAKIAGEIKGYLEAINGTDLVEKIDFFVAENLGSPEEKCCQYSLAEVQSQEFPPLNVVCIVNRNDISAPSPLGLSEDDIHHSRGLITKNEVRAASIHALQLPLEGVVWDVGAGSGSISIEAARMAPELTIYAIEQRPEEIDNIIKNIKKFSCFNIIPLHGRAEDFLHSLPKPDRIFVGGSGGALKSITQKAAQVLPENGRLVVNSVLAKTATEAPQFMAEASMDVQISTISVQRLLPEKVTFNPITITTGIV